jgi:DNA primase
VGGYIQEDVIDRIRSSTDIVEVLSDYIPLKKAGQNYKGLCPFHPEKTPSFIVSPSKQLYHCFGCGVGGDVVNFLVRYENLSFPEAIRVLAKKAGIKIEVRPTDKKIKTERESLLKINKEAEDYFHRILLGPSGKTARGYLLKRGIKEKTIKDFKLGFSLPTWEGLINAMQEKGYSSDLLNKAGLIIPRESGKGYYDRFRGRIIFPIYNIEGDVIGFGGRVLDDTLPKYLNSPETPVYYKGENLFAIERAKEYVRKEGFLILVEGYMDAIALHQSGIQNTGATLGTALTKGHLKAIKRFTNKVIVVFDADPAGRRAASLGLDIFLEGGMEVKVSSLPQGDDPDSFIIREGKDKFINLIKGAQNLIDFSLKQILTDTPKMYNRTGVSSNGISKFNEALYIISKIPNSIERGYHIKRLAEETGIDERFFMEELKKLKAPKKKYQTPDSRLQTQDRPKAEEILIHLMLKDKGIANEILDNLSPEDFTYLPFKTLARGIKDSIEKFDKVMPERILSVEDNQSEGSCGEVLGILSELSLREIEYEDIRKVIDDCLIYMDRSEKKRRLSELQLRIKEAELRGEDEVIPALLSESTDLIRGRKERG